MRDIPASRWDKDAGSAVFDEIQKEPSLFEKIKYAYDADSVGFSILLGSSQILLLKKIRESLAGRISIYELWPLMMSEILSPDPNTAPKPLLDEILSGNKISPILEKTSQIFGEEDAKLKEAESYLLRWGGMPALLHLPDEERRKWLKDYEYSYLERDLADLARLSDLDPFRKFQKRSALRASNLLNYSELARDAAVSVDTAKRYLEYLRISYQVLLLQPYFANHSTSLVKTPKLYWIDVGLLRQMTGIWGETSGALYENMVVSEIAKWLKTLQKNAEMYFYRTRGGLEVDVILEVEGKGVIGLEIKNRETVALSDATALKRIAQVFKERWLGGIVISRGDRIRKIADPDIWSAPSRRLFS